MVDSRDTKLGEYECIVEDCVVTDQLYFLETH